MTFTKNDAKAAQDLCEALALGSEDAMFLVSHDDLLPRALAALEEARRKTKIFRQSLHDIRCCIVNLAQNGGELNVDNELIALIEVIDNTDDRLRAAEEG